eukprot:9163420-Lingulodinium_polyedra.AAC.1
MGTTDPSADNIDNIMPTCQIQSQTHTNTSPNKTWAPNPRSRRPRRNHVSENIRAFATRPE